MTSPSAVPPFPPMVAAAPPAPPPLRPAGPAQSEWLLHFCSRPPNLPQSSALPPDIAAMNPVTRLVSILQQRQLRVFPPFGFGVSKPMVCLSECPLPHLQWLLTQRQFP